MKCIIKLFSIINFVQTNIYIEKIRCKKTRRYEKFLNWYGCCNKFKQIRNDVFVNNKTRQFLTVAWKKFTIPLTDVFNRYSLVQLKK